MPKPPINKTLPFKKNDPFFNSLEFFTNFKRQSLYAAVGTFIA